MRVLVHAAAGGVGSAAVQAARAARRRGRGDGRLGGEARAAPVARRGPGRDLRGLDEIEPVDVVFDPVGGELFADSLKLIRPLGTAIAIGFAGGAWQPLDPALLVGRNISAAGFYLGRLMPLAARTRPCRRRVDLLRLWGAGLLRPVVGATFPLAEAAGGAPAARGAPLDRQGGARPMKALVTGGASGIGAAIVARLRAEGYEVEPLDLVTGFDVSDPAAWEAVGPVDLACLNAGVLTGEADVARADGGAVSARARVNVDGVVLGVRRLARVLEPGSVIVATASLAGLVGDSGRPDLRADEARGRRLRAQRRAAAGAARDQDPGRLPRLGGHAPDRRRVQGRAAARGYRLLRAEDVAEAVLVAARSEGTGEAWVVQPGREPINYAFKGVPGPR